jgi:hypothetical protein
MMNQKQLIWQKFSFALAITWTVATLITYPTSVQAQPARLVINSDSVELKYLNQKESDSDNLDFSGTGRPNKQTAGGSRPAGCPKVEQPLTALVPQEMGLTATDSPIFWFYIPYKSQDVQTGEFVLQDERGEKDIYRTPVTFSKTPGIVSIRLPLNLPESLEINRSYLWSLVVFCNPKDTDINVFVEGYVQRVKPNSSLQGYRDYTNNKLWYDALNDLAQRRLQAPEEPKLKKDWENLLKAVGLESLAPEPLVSCCSSAN